MINPNKSPILDPNDRPPLLPPLRETTHYDNGQPKSEWTDNPDGSWSEKGHYGGGQIESERVAGSDGSCIDMGYYDNGQIEYKSIDNPNGSSDYKRYDQNGRLLGDPVAPARISSAP